jgi:hypothetical protein
LERLHTTNQPKKKKGETWHRSHSLRSFTFIKSITKKSCCIQTKAVAYNISGKS